MEQKLMDDQKENRVKKIIIGVFSLSEYKIKNKVKILKDLINHYKSELVGKFKIKKTREL